MLDFEYIFYSLLTTPQLFEILNS